MDSLKIYILKIFSDNEKKTILTNFVSLSFLQMANYILPLLTVPYLIRVIGINNVGILALATALCTYLQIITDYGFNLSATRQVSINRLNKDKLIEIYSSVITIKLILGLLCLGILFIIINCVEKFKEFQIIYLLTYGLVLGQILFPIWFFQGMEKMKYITYINVSIKLLFTIMIFLVVKKTDNFWLVPTMTSIGGLIAGVIAMFVVRKYFGITFRIQKYVVLKNQFCDGWHIFTSRIFSSLYKNSAVLILGLLTTHEITGYYSVAEKIIRSIQSVQNVIGDALYPHLVKKFDKNKNGFYSLNEKYKYIIIVAYILMTVVVLGMSGIMTKVLTGRHPGNVKLDLEIMSFVVLFGGLNYYYGILGLVALNYKKEFSTYVLITGIISILLTVVLSKFFNDIGAAFAAVLSEAILFILIIIKLKKLELKYGR